MKITITEKLNLALISGDQAYKEWNNLHHIPDYLSVILYELLMRQKISQKELVKLTNLPKQSINKGIKLLQHQGYLEMKIYQRDKRKKFCQLTITGKKYAQGKMHSLFKLEEKTVQRLGMQKMQQLIALSQEWNDTFWELLKEEKNQ